MDRPTDPAYITRHTESRVRTALSDTRIVALVGPRQSGKTTLARRIAASDKRPYLTLDDDQFQRFAQDDPAGFLRDHDVAMIDEIQRAPKLILALKKTVDDDPRPGRFLITGSVDLFKGTISPDSLAGRVETVELLPLSQAEIGALKPPTFIEQAFAGEFPALATLQPTADLIERVLSGGYPEVLRRELPARRQTWLRDYAQALAEHDIADIAMVGKPDAIARLAEHLALGAGDLLNMSKLGSRLGVDAKTIDRWLVLMEHMFLVRRIRAWHSSGLKRLVKTPKLAFLDSGLLAALRRVAAADVQRNRQRLGSLLECFVHGELAKAVALTDDTITISHYRDKDRVEVDLVLERSPGSIVGIEVKAAATVRPEDFRGLKRLQDIAGERFRCGIVLHDGDRVQRVGPGLFAMPVEMLWRA